jgi:CheY-like chemotaxis protein
MRAKTIVVVDDAPASLKVVEMLLRNDGYEVHTAPDAESALDILRTVKPAVMLVDIQLPGMSGLDLARRVKQDSRTSEICVIAVTAFTTLEDEERARAAGCDGYIMKPINTRSFAKYLFRQL